MHKMETVEIRSMADARPNNCEEENVATEGRVEQVCREWLVREDGVLAYKLQTEEIQQHYNHNRDRNRLARSDLQEAKSAQKNEEEEAVIIKQAYEQMLQEQEAEDARVAEQLQKELEQEDIEKQRHVEEDERLARQLQEKEKQRLGRKRLEWEMRQVEKVRSHHSSVSSFGHGESSQKVDDEAVLSKAFHKASLIPTSEPTSNDDKDSDLSDFCLKPPPGLKGDELKKFQEEQDAELARLLQEQEKKRRGPSFKDQQLAIEAQDRELARVLQEQERAKAKKAREKARQKALMQQQQHDMETIEEVGCTSPDARDDKINRSSLERRLHQESERISEETGVCTSGVPNHAIQNIAMAIDPTYNRQRGTSFNSNNSTQAGSPVSSPNRTLNLSPGESSTNCGTDNSYFEGNSLEDYDGAVPPYMPIQGQRRTSSLDKGKKLRKQKDGCKTQ